MEVVEKLEAESCGLMKSAECVVRFSFVTGKVRGTEENARIPAGLTLEEI